MSSIPTLSSLKKREKAAQDKLRLLQQAHTEFLASWEIWNKAKDRLLEKTQRRLISKS